MKTRRIEQGFRHRFRALLARVHPRRLEFGVELLMGRGRERSQRQGLPLAEGLARLYEETREKVDRRVRLMAACTVGYEAAPALPLRFLCDLSLGGLARWLRAAGYPAEFSEHSGDALLRAAEATGATLLTTDSRLWERRRVRDGTLPALWLPSGLPVPRQLAMVWRDLGLVRREPRCMACGGELRGVEKASVADRIPPRTARWKDDYFLCQGCDRLFWRGTHWERILARLPA